MIFHRDTIFYFGKHKDQSVEHVAAHNPAYLNWVFQNLRIFCMHAEELDGLVADYPQLQLPADRRQALIDQAEAEAQRQQARNENASPRQANDRPRFKQMPDPDTFLTPDADDYPRYGKYGGPMINNVELDDDLIDNALEGDPENYWNID